MGKVIITRYNATSEGVILETNTPAKLKTGNTKQKETYVSWDKIGKLLFDDYTDAVEVSDLRGLRERPETGTVFYCVEVSINNQAHWWTGNIPHLSIRESEMGLDMWTTDIIKAKRFTLKEEAEKWNKDFEVNGEVTEHAWM